MKKILSALFYFISFSISSQTNVKPFDIKIAEIKKVEGAKYGTILIADMRLDKNFCGFAQTGLLNSIAKIVPTPPLKQQINKVMSRLVPNFVGLDTLVLEIDHLSFAEVTRFSSEKGYVNIKVQLYKKQNDVLYFIDSLDVNKEVSGLDVTNKMLNKGGEIIIKFLSKNLTVEPDKSEPIMSMKVMNRDSIEKSKIPLYNEGFKFVDGLYTDFESFINQKPITQVEIKYKKEKKFEKLVDKKTRVYLDLQDYYAVIDNGIPYILTDYGNYEIFVDNKNKALFFNGKAENKNKNNTGVAIMSAGFGLVGGILYMSLSGGGGGTSKYKIIIDHRDGTLYPVEKI
jgi:hypothetical protein